MTYIIAVGTAFRIVRIMQSNVTDVIMSIIEHLQWDIDRYFI